MTPPVAVRPESFKSSSKAFGEIHTTIRKAAFTLVSELGEMASMAGTDPKAKAFADSYEEIVNGNAGACAGIKLLADATDKMAELLDASSVNHTNADNAYAPCTAGVPTGIGYVGGELTKPRIASAFGGPGEPSNWEMIKSYVEGEVFPDGDPEKMDRAAAAWRKMGTVLREQSGRVDAAIAHIAQEKSAEVEPAQNQAALIKKHLANAAGTFDKISQLLTEFASHVRSVRDETKSALTDLAWELAGGLILGAALTLVTAGASNLASTAIGLLRLTQTGAKIAQLIRKFGTAIDKVMHTASSIENRFTSTAGDLADLLGSRAKKFSKDMSRKKKSDEPKRRSELDEATKGMPDWARKDLELATDPDALERKLVDGGMPPELAKEAAQNTPHAKMTPQEVVDKYWDSDKGRWNYPPDDGFLGGNYTTSTSIPETVKLDRIGGPNGGFLADEGVPYSKRALSPGTAGEYNTYRGTGVPLDSTKFEVRTGPAAEAFGQPGQGNQWVVIDLATGKPVSVTELLRMEVIE
ncbi:TNT domain-containing protein [Tsukamurella pulmonis]|uniref:TNT domain-containing protein n=1 Tax=Tsukamurella pulmonis TaxID=47312 RepID=UPI001401E03E|nr:TNT domain-containing protein [Tsukamurella pulmonis]